MLMQRTVFGTANGARHRRHRQQCRWLSREWRRRPSAKLSQPSSSHCTAGGAPARPLNAALRRIITVRRGAGPPIHKPRAATPRALIDAGIAGHRATAHGPGGGVRGLWDIGAAPNAVRTRATGRGGGPQQSFLNTDRQHLKSKIPIKIFAVQIPPGNRVSQTRPITCVGGVGWLVGDAAPGCRVEGLLSPAIIAGGGACMWRVYLHVDHFRKDDPLRILPRTSDGHYPHKLK
jgi:hypothetical protein